MNQSRVFVLMLLATLLLMTPSVQALGAAAIVYDVLEDGDLGFGDMVRMGSVRAARDLNIAVTRVVDASASELLPTLRQWAGTGEYDVIIASGFQYADAITHAAREFPEQKFAFIDGDVQAPNVLSILFAEQEGSALVGALAALTALEHGSDVIGIVLGVDSPGLRRFESGYKWGAQWAVERYNERNGTNRSVEALSVYTGTFSDPAAGKQAAEAQLSQGAAVIYNAAGATGLGIFDAVEEAARAVGQAVGPPFAIGVDGVQDHLLPGFVPASMVKRLDDAVLLAVEKALDGTFSGGTLVLDLDSGGVGLSTDELHDDLLAAAIDAGVSDPAQRAEVLARVKAAREAIPAHVWELVKDLERRVKSGDILVP